MFTSPDQKMLDTIQRRRRECAAMKACLLAGLKLLSDADLLELGRCSRRHPRMSFHQSIWAEIRRRVLELPITTEVVNRGSTPPPQP